MRDRIDDDLFATVATALEAIDDTIPERNRPGYLEWVDTMLKYVKESILELKAPRPMTDHDATDDNE